MNPDRSNTSPLTRLMRPLIGVGTVLVVTAGAVAVAQGASPDRAPSAASTTPVTGESMVVESSPVEQPAASMEGHPLVGAWLFTPESTPEGRRHPAAFSSDGIYWMVDLTNVPSIGSWEPTGPNSATLTLVDQIPDGAGGLVTETIRATIEVAPDGQSWTADFTSEVSGGGFPEGEYGPGTVSATRIAAEPPGTPVGGFDELVPSSSEGTEVPPTTG